MLAFDEHGEDVSMVWQAQTDSPNTVTSGSDIDTPDFSMPDLRGLGLGRTGASRGSQLSTRDTETIASRDELSLVDDYTLVRGDGRGGGAAEQGQLAGGRYLNDASFLSQGHIFSRHAKKEYTIILVGETGVGKTSLLTFIWNVLNERLPPAFKLQIHDRSNESGLGSGASQTNNAKLYTFISRNGVVLKILDTPGLSDTRGIDLDNEHKEKIARSVKDLIVSVDAVLIMANGTNPRLTASSSYALTSLSSIFPKSLAKNIGMLFTNVADSMSMNFEKSSLPKELQSAETFYLDNPASLEEKRRVDPGLRPERKSRRVAEVHEDALETMAGFFNWLDTRSPQPTNDIVALYEHSLKIERQVLNSQSQLAQAMSATRSLKKLQKLLETTQAVNTIQCIVYRNDFHSDIHGIQDLPMLRRFDSIVLRRTFDFEQSTVPVNACQYPGCHGNCHIDCKGAQGLFWWVNPKRCHDCWGHTLKLWVYPACNACGHARSFHKLSSSEWATREHASDAGDAATREILFASLTQGEKNEHLSREINNKLAYYARRTDDNMEVLSELAESYAVTALSGDYSSQLEEGVRISKETIRVMREKSGDKVLVAKMLVSVLLLEKKLKTLKDAQAKKQQRMIHTA